MCNSEHLSCKFINAVNTNDILNPNFDSEFNLVESKIKNLGLITACANNNVEILEKILKFDSIDVNTVDKKGLTPLMHAIQKSCLEIIKLLLSHPQIDINKHSGQYNKNALAIAIDTGYDEIIMLLLDNKNINLNCKRKINCHYELSCGVQNMFLYLCRDYWNAPMDIIKKILDDPSLDLNQPTDDNKTPFYYACANNSKNIVSLLLKMSDIDYNKRANNGRNGLLIALEKKHFSLVKILIQNEQIDVSCLESLLYDLYLNSNTHELVLLIIKRKDINLNQTFFRVVSLIYPQTTLFDLGLILNDFALLDTLINHKDLKIRCVSFRDPEPFFGSDVGIRPKKIKYPLSDIIFIDNWYSEYSESIKNKNQKNRQIMNCKLIKYAKKQFATKLFILIRLLAEDFLRIKIFFPTKCNRHAKRFFKITHNIPVELQMIIANRACGSTSEFIPSEWINALFKKVIKGKKF